MTGDDSFEDSRPWAKTWPAISRAIAMRNNDRKQTSRKDIRSLSNLGETASTSRVLNLSNIFKVSGQEKEYRAAPFFRDSQLNKAILVKHTLRPNERALFSSSRRTGTKVILPFDPLDLRLGGSSIFVNQHGFDRFIKDFFDDQGAGKHVDIEVLKALDAIPSLDPFLVKEHLGRLGVTPASCYLKISSSDVNDMIGFANSEIEKLVVTAFGGAIKHGTFKLASKILSNELDIELTPLRSTFRMKPEEFSDGIFSWRAFLYFKWRHLTLQSEIEWLLKSLSKYQPSSTLNNDVKAYIEQVKPRLARQIYLSIVAVSETLSVYDRAYSALVVGKEPSHFRNFLINGPELFYELGENIGILSHICSFWNYRMGSGSNHLRLPAEDYADILMDFEESLAVVHLNDERSRERSISL
ncbi:hypothetical protein OVA03_16470 [Asticcacaulis sp. SL142]|uniref:hypothetical protein n=1 Tax=Asticcacaulis sp. SL142 TaxID=2995155 RepID=UPI00226CF23D|nr:hypothetical protein [Asticcacaulis sp. SL142]WAC48261.1 hypothetical protein OVA03_16470 [Asticcacaulis sp. SL142]